MLFPLSRRCAQRIHLWNLNDFCVISVTKISTFVFQIDLTKKNRELKKKLGIYFDSEFPALSIGDVFRAIRALLRVEKAFALVFSPDLSTEDASPKEML